MDNIKSFLSAVLPELQFWTAFNSVMAVVNTSVSPVTIYKGFLIIFASLFQLFDNPNYPLKDESFYITPPENLRPKYDYIIVGGGTAGCLIANRLSVKNNVLLIEAGGITNVLNIVPAFNLLNQNNPLSLVDWIYKSTKQTDSFSRMHDGYKAQVGGGRGLGGGSQLNYQIYSRGKNANYDRWESKYGAKGWNGTEMTRYMKMAENCTSSPLSESKNHGTEGEVEIALAPCVEDQKLVDLYQEVSAKITKTEILKDYNDPIKAGFAVTQNSVDSRGRISSSARSFIEPVRAARTKTLHIILHSMVQRVVIEKGVATGVVVKKYSAEKDSCEEEEKTYSAKKEVILAAGALRSPQILLLSGVGPKKVLDDFKIPVQHVLEGVGQNLHDHIGVLGMSVIYPNGKGFYDLSLRSIVEFFGKHEGRLRSPGGLKSIGFFNSDVIKDPSRGPDIELVLQTSSPNTMMGPPFFGSFGWFAQDFDYFMKEAVGTDPQGLTIVPLLLRGNTRGNVTIASNDTCTRPVVNYQYLLDPVDVATMVSGMKTVLKITKELLGYADEGHYIKSIIPGCEQFANDTEGDDYLACHAKTKPFAGMHHGGTCSMGNGTLSVLDEKLKVKGIKGLRVCDAAAAPEEVSGHMFATVYGIAEKCADMILNP